MNAKEKLMQMYKHWFGDDLPPICRLSELEMLEQIAIEVFLAGEDATCYEFDNNEIWLIKKAIKDLRNGVTKIEDCYGWDEIDEW